jgi:hypothetical protein
MEKEELFFLERWEDKEGYVLGFLLGERGGFSEGAKQ